MTLGTLGCRPRARSVLHCHGVLALRGGPLTGAVEDASQLQKDTSKFGTWQCRKAGNPIRPSLPWCFSPAKGSLTGAVQDASQLQEDAGKLGGGSAGRQANGKFAASLLPLWAVGRGPDPSFTAMVF